MKNNSERLTFERWYDDYHATHSIGYMERCYESWQARAELAKHDKAALGVICDDLKYDNTMLRGKIVELRDEQIPALKAGIEKFISSADQYIQASEQHVALLPLYEALALLKGAEQ